MMIILEDNQILSLTQSDDYLQNPAKQAKVKEYEREIDQMVYSKSTDEEIKIVEGENEIHHIQCDESICMPNHIHFIVINVGADLCVCPDTKGEHIGSPLQRIVQWFKTMTTNDYIKNVKNNDWKPFDKKLWQRNYYEHVIRNENELNKIREYIIYNPHNWIMENRKLIFSASSTS